MKKPHDNHLIIVAPVFYGETFEKYPLFLRLVSRELRPTPSGGFPVSQSLCHAQILILEILNVFLRLKFSPSLILNKIWHFSKVSWNK